MTFLLSFFSSIYSFLCFKVHSLSLHKVLDGSESQYSGMQIGTLQDEEDEGSAPTSQEEPSEPFLQPVLGAFQLWTAAAVLLFWGTSALQCGFISLLAALSNPHLFENRGHNRQGSDSSMDRFVPKDEPAEPEPDNKVKKKKSVQPLNTQTVKCFLYLYRTLLLYFSAVKD